MRSFRTVLGCFILAVPLGVISINANGVGPAEKPKTMTEVLSVIHVVEAKVTGIREVPKPGADIRAAVATMTVTAVYCGDGLHEGDSFDALTRDGPPWYDKLTVEVPDPIPHVGDIALWQVYPDREGNGFHGNRDTSIESYPMQRLLFFDPFMGSEGRHRPELAAAAPKVAKALQSLVNAPDDKERLRVLADQARTNDRYVATAVCSILALSPATDPNTKLGRELFLDAKVPTRARMILDVMLCRSAGAEWWDSEVRLQGLRQLVSADRDPDDFFAVGERLAYGARDLQFSMKQCISIVREGIKNERLLLAYGSSLSQLMIFANSARDASERDAAFEYFETLFKSAASDNLRRAAAAGLSRTASAHIPLTELQVAAIKILRDSATDKDTVGYLDIALNVTAEKLRMAKENGRQ